MFEGRRSLWWLLGPVVLYLLALPLYNRVDPVLLGLPFFMFWTLMATVLTPVCIWLAARSDPLWAADRDRARGADDAGDGSDAPADSEGDVR
ncbi:DUF3311 domain-containing protein [Saccharopolyspora erythraea]|uniref:DUF3311 domain-containing protein n=1 Tax=Saccharopolyspora erythraea TaxID=1836 RepID=UPI001BA7EE6B|nr:DUF3311 domain-containing protein [Saccharopolyspora erythraea]QUH04746.1 DUF3311 domain-containing protein [Saccharopolyspora erythraea]